MCGNFKFARVRPSADERLAMMAYETGIRGERVPPMEPVAMVTGPEMCVLARWGWPSKERPGEPIIHARREGAETHPVWNWSWHMRRGVVPVVGWWEGGMLVDAPGAHIAVLWTPLDGKPVFAVVTQPEPVGSKADRYPYPLTEAGALAWLAGGGLEDQVRTLHEYAQESLF